MPTLYDLMRQHAEHRPEKLALISEQDGTRTYGELVDNEARLAHMFVRELGFPPGERSCLWMWNRPEFVEIQHAASAVGLPPVLANPDWTDAEMEFVLGHSGARFIVCEPDLAERALALAERSKTLDCVITLGDSVPEGALSLGALRDAAPSDAGAGLPPVPADVPGHLMYTSGTTTGRPKAVRFERDFPRNTPRYDEMLGLGPSDRSLFVTPLFHGNGAAGLISALSLGASAVFQRRFSARRFWPLVDRTRPSYLLTLAPIVHILLGLRTSAFEREHSLRMIVALGAGPAATLMEERYGVPVIDWYGMTEAGLGTYTRLSEERRPGSSGRRFEGSGMTILREDGSEADPGEVGEVGFATEATGFQGYLDDDEATRAAISDGYFHTGDLGRFDSDGYFYFVDRKKDIVRRGGENISSAEVETVLCQHPDVAEIAIVGRPDPVLGERVAAFVVPTEGSAPPDASSLERFAESKLAAYKLPEVIVPVEVLPRTATGKVEKFRLRKQLDEPQS
jgi:acyl-CoA synthetase (AMP-forming)/AMP-acid ligase II